MTAKPENPPAFPFTEEGTTEFSGQRVQLVNPGMSLRDWFAGQAIAAIPDHLCEIQTDHRIKIAEWCYGLADAMLAERSKTDDR